MRRILVPCDFTEPALRGLRLAIEIAAATGGTVIVLSVIKHQQDEAFVFKRFKEDFEEVITKISQPVKILHLIRSGKLVPIVIDLIADESIDLVVIGSRGSRGWEGSFMGSNVEKLLRISTVPVLAVKQESHFRNIKQIVFPCDLMHPDHFDITELKNLQAQLDARLHLLWVDTSREINQAILIENLMDYALIHGLSKYTVNVIREPDEKDGILHFAKEIGADMIAMTTHGAPDLNHLFTTSITADVVNHAHLPTWTCLQHPVKQ